MFAKDDKTSILVLTEEVRNIKHQIDKSHIDTQIYPTSVFSSESEQYLRISNGITQHNCTRQDEKEAVIFVKHNGIYTHEKSI